MKRGLIGCSTLLKAINLQYELAGHHIYTHIHPALHGYGLVPVDKNTVTGLCDCRQGRDPCTCKNVCEPLGWASVS